jgi:tRNA(Ile)-lysidine synthase
MVDLSPRAGPFAVSVSGGPDSLALLLLAAAAFPGQVRAATVDHGLREESAAEAQFVAALCQSLGVPHATLPASVDRSSASLQKQARAARYEALAGWMEELGITTVATAHHADDQAETLLMRLLRGSGVAGLAGIRARGPLPGTRSDATVIRPLLGWRRADLAALVADAGLDAVDDASNRDPSYDRVRIRERLAATPWLDPQPIAHSAAALGDADAALEWVVERLRAERIAPTANGFRLDPSSLPHELRRRLLLHILRELGRGPVPRGDEAERLLESLQSGETATLSGVRCKGGESWTFTPAAPHRRSG